ncbi:sensor histidine kinase [Glycomyces tarimensis]
MQAASRLGYLRVFLREHPFTADVIFTAALYACTALSLAAVIAAAGPPAEYGWTGAAWTAVGMVPIAFRRKRPWGAVGMVIAVLALATLLQEPWLIGDNGLSWMILTYTAAAHRPVGRALAVTAAIWVPVSLWLYFYFWPELLGIDDALGRLSLTLLNLIIVITTFFVGWVMRNRRMKIEELSDRARIAEQSREALAEQAVADEQRRIARELHDVVAHHISVIGVMSEGAKRVLRLDPDAAEEALTTVNQTARTALREMRDILTVLRNGNDESQNAQLEPQPTVDSLRALVAQTKEAGLPVRYSVHGEEYPLPTGVSLAVYRIVQEALTNTIKHAGPKAKAGVVVDYGEREFRVSIGDSGRGAPVTSDFSGGHGIIGMRERATLYGGTLQAGPQAGGGYLVEARFPKNAHLQGVKP